jgi:cytochrome c2
MEVQTMAYEPVHLVTWRRWAWVLLMGCIILALAAPAALLAAPPGQSAGEGETLFQSKCIACHKIGGGAGVGPDLAGVTGRRDRAWLSQWILAPDQVLAAGDPIATQLFQEYKNVPMPNLGLSEAQVAGLIAYLENPGTQTVAEPQAPLAAGDASHGRALFTGASRMENGGPPCMSCHSIAGLGALGGGALGPDLTAAYNNWGGDSGLATFLNSVPTLTMNAVWTRQPLTAAEQDDLRAFMQEASIAERPPEMVWQLALLATALMALFLLLAHFFWRKRLVSVRQTMVERARI